MLPLHALTGFPLTLFFTWLFKDGTESRSQGDLCFPWALVIYLDLALLVGLGWVSLAFRKGTDEERQELHFWHDLSSQ